ncbi:MAG: hypothetical protein J6S21_03435 [Victivallales bacterium]|nr:hypothetical protein [Victivallales bacterium]
MLDPIVPFLAVKDGDLRRMLEVKERTGIHRFMVVGIHCGMRMIGPPPDEEYARFGELLRSLREAAEPHGIEIGWWCAPCLKIGPSPYQRITGLKGGISTISACPLDEEFIADFCRRVKIVASIGRPASILLEDDYQLSNHPGVGVGCFCPLHLEKFREYAGRYYSREELEELFTKKPKESMELRRLWAKMSCDTMAACSSALRRAVDEVDPAIRLWACEPGTTDLDGKLSLAVPKALAGPAHAPAVRICGTQYCSRNDAREIPSCLAHVMYDTEHLPPEYELLHETDTYPHNRYFSSAALMESILTGAIFEGCHNTLFYGGQYLDNPAEDTGYFDMYRRNERRLREIQRFTAESRLDGCQIVFKPEYDFIRSRQLWDGDSAITALRACAGILGRWGIPYTTRERKVKLLPKAALENMDNGEILTLLKGSLLLDSEAATELARRGFAEYLGVKIRIADMIPAVEEYILDNAPADFSRGRRIYNNAFAPAGSEGAQYAEIQADGAEVLTVYRGPFDSVVQPGLTRFINSLGGRIVVMGCAFLNESSNLFCYRKRELMRRLICWLAEDELPASVLNAPNIWMLFREAENAACIMVNNLCPDPLEKLELEVADCWKDAHVEELNSDGEWTAAECTRQGKNLTISGTGSFMHPRIFRLKR